MATYGSGPRMTWLGKLLVMAIVAALGWGAWQLYERRGDRGATLPPVRRAARDGRTTTVAVSPEKRRWLEWAAREFEKTDEGRGSDIAILPMPSMDAVDAIVSGDAAIAAWSPSSSALKQELERHAQLAGRKLIAREESLATSPMAFAIWSGRHDAIRTGPGAIPFGTAARALATPQTWGWFKLAIADPARSHAGLMTLVLLAYEHHGKSSGLKNSDVVDAAFLEKLSAIKRGATLYADTAAIVRDMTANGPAAVDAAFLYESSAVEVLRSAQKRWGELQIVYPAVNIWSDHPYYVLHTPASDESREVAEAFLQFLTGDESQRQALARGFRPRSRPTPETLAEGPFPLQPKGATGAAVELPSPDVLRNLLAAWQRAR